MKIIKVAFIIFLALTIIAVVSFFLFRGFFLKQIETIAIAKLQSILKKEVDISKISYMPVKGLELTGIHIYDKETPKESGIFIKSIAAKAKIAKLMKSKELHLSLWINSLKKDKAEASGSLFIKSGMIENISTPWKDFKLCSVEILDIDILSPYANIEDIKGTITCEDGGFSSDNIKFLYQDKPHNLLFRAINLNDNPSVQINIKGPEVTLDSGISKVNDIVKINNLDITMFESKFDINGEITNFDDPTLLLYGNFSINTPDLCYLSPGMEKTCEYLRLEGRLNSRFHIIGPLVKPKKWEVAIKGNSDMLKLWDYRFHNLVFESKIADGIIDVPVLNANPYKGDMALSCKIDTSKKYAPYAMKLALRNVDVNGFAQDSELNNKNIYGRLGIDLYLEGKGSDSMSTIGKGTIVIAEANLGPMPILAPLVGHMYGGLRKMIPSLKSVEINAGTCDFFIRDRKIMTENLKLWGDILDISARGYIDFDKNLNFEVENQFKDAKETGEDWQNKLIEIMAGFGKFIGKAHLTGTMKNPKWKFEYFSQLEDSLGGKIQDVFKDIFR